jgi:hypothetical protein
MNASPLQRRTLYGVLFLIVFSAFLADVVDLREELGILPCACSALDSSVADGAAVGPSIEPEPFSPRFSLAKETSVDVSFRHLLPNTFRAPPSRS